MATVVLGAAGAAIGGPAGLAVGSILGRQIDRSFGQRAQARVLDLKVPSAQYGDPIPRIVRRMRVSGIVLWASEPVATATVSKNGSVQGSSASFAFALSTGRVESVARIWADGRLIRDALGQQSVPFSMRLHEGNEDQPCDPLIESILGEALTPAFRGVAYIVFENFDLSSFGNRLPLLTVEVAGTGDPLLAEQVIAARLGLSSEDIEEGRVLEGVALLGSDEASAVAALVEAFTPTFAYASSEWSMKRSAVRHDIPEDLWRLQASKNSTTTIDATQMMPSRISIRYFDPEIDFAAGEKSARLPGSERVERIELPAAMMGSQAKAAAVDRLAHAEVRSRSFWVKLPLSFARIAIGDEVTCSAYAAGAYRVCEKTFSKGELLLGLKPQTEMSKPMAAEPGGGASYKALVRNPLRVELIELPGEPFASEPQLSLQVSGGAVPFEAMPVTLSRDGAERLMASSDSPSACGTLATSLAAGPTGLLDSRSWFEVQFDQDPLLLSCDHQALLAGENLLFVNGEFLQFATAVPLGNGRYRLTDLVRGRFDTAQDSAHAVAATVCLLRTASSQQISLGREAIGGSVAATVHGPDGLEADTQITIKGLAAQPWAPCHVEVTEVAGGLQVSWFRRCKEGVPWLDGVDAPLGSSQERYAVQINSAHGEVVELITSAQSARITSSVLEQLGAKPWEIRVRQLGDYAAGRNAKHVIY